MEKINEEVAFFVKPSTLTDLSLTNDIRSFLSSVKVNGEAIDSWTKFAINDYYDVDDHGPINKIINFIPPNSISEIKILFPDPWPKTKHKSRRLIQPIFIEYLCLILAQNGTITVGTDHPVLKSWVLEQFQSNQGLEWLANDANHWRTRPFDCFSTKYEKKAYKENRFPSWFIFKKIKN